MHFEPNRGRSRGDRPHTHHLRHGVTTPSRSRRPAPAVRAASPVSTTLPAAADTAADDAAGRARSRPRGRLHSRRGAIREATLALLAEQPMHGYQVMQELGERSGGRWRPSAGSVYPTLQQLEDEGLVTVEDRDGRRTFALTEPVATAAEAIPADRPWTPRRTRRRPPRARPGTRRSRRSRSTGSGTAGRPGSGSRTILTEARRSLYRLLAEDDATAG